MYNMYKTTKGGRSHLQPNSNVNVRDIQKKLSKHNLMYVIFGESKKTKPHKCM